MAILVKSETPAQQKNRWGTQWGCFYDGCALTGGRFILDACTEPQTAKCANFISPGEDALKVDWVDRVRDIERKFASVPAIHPNNRPIYAWCNPPFDKKEAFLNRAFLMARNGLPVLCLVPYERSTQWWRDTVRHKATRVFIPDGRYNFLNVDGKTKKTGVNFLTCFVEFGIGAGWGETQFIDFNRGIHKQPN